MGTGIPTGFLRGNPTVMGVALGCAEEATTSNLLADTFAIESCVPNNDSNSGRGSTLRRHLRRYQNELGLHNSQADCQAC